MCVSNRDPRLGPEQPSPVAEQAPPCPPRWSLPRLASGASRPAERSSIGRADWLRRRVAHHGPPRLARLPHLAAGVAVRGRGRMRQGGDLAAGAQCGASLDSVRQRCWDPMMRGVRGCLGSGAQIRRPAGGVGGGRGDGCVFFFFERGRRMCWVAG